MSTHHLLFCATTVWQKRLPSTLRSERHVEGRKAELFNHRPALITFCNHLSTVWKKKTSFLFFSPSFHLTPRRSLSSVERRTQKHFARSAESLDLSQLAARLLRRMTTTKKQRRRDGLTDSAFMSVHYKVRCTLNRKKTGASDPEFLKGRPSCGKKINTVRWRRRRRRRLWMMSGGEKRTRHQTR